MGNNIQRKNQVQLSTVHVLVNIANENIVKIIYPRKTSEITCQYLNIVTVIVTG